MLTFRSCLLFILAACGPTAPVSTAADGGGGSTDPVDDPTSTPTSTSTSTNTSTTVEPTGTTGGFVSQPDIGGPMFINPMDGGICTPPGPYGAPRSGCVCDPWVQDCIRGEKCSPYDGSGDDVWDLLRCVPLDRAPGHPGDPCTVEGGVATGIDSCDIDSMCWAVDPMTLAGTCVLRCQGSPDDPTCPPGSSCLVAVDGVVALCLPECDPLMQDCSGDDLCIPNPQEPGAFICVDDGSGAGGQAFDDCDRADACDKGLLCADPTLATECDQDAPGCCLPFCDTTVPDQCPGAMQQCLPWFPDQPAPPGLENLGVCGIPQ